MKQLFTLTALALCLSLNINAQVRKTWDFTKGFSAITVYNLEKDAETGTSWTNLSEPNGSRPVYFESKLRSNTGPLTAFVDGSEVTIPEFEGLIFKGVSAKHINIVQKSDGQGYVWLNGKKAEDHIVIPKIAPGEKVTIDFESHSSTQARGFKSVTGGFVDFTDGSTTQWTSTVRDTAVVINNNTDSTDYEIAATNGFHVYSIIVGEGDDPNAFKSKVAYIYTGDLDSDPAYASLKNDNNIIVTPLDAATILNKEDLQSYDVDILSSTIPSDNDNVTTLKEVQPFVPTLNFNANLYKAWGYGEATATEDVAAVTSEGDKPLFTGLTLVSAEEAGLEAGQAAVAFSESNPIVGVKLGKYYANDDIIATALTNPSVVAIHEHNISHNGYIYLPFSSEVLSTPYNADGLIANALTILAASKAAIDSTAAPTFNIHYAQQNATVAIESPAPYAQIYYTIDGTEPTISTGTLYTEPFNLTAESTVKAIVQGQGYYPSVVVDTLVKMYDQAATPTISVTQADDAATITLEDATEGVNIYYNFSGVADSVQSVKYNGPFVINDHKTVYAFAASADYVQSETASKDVYVQNDKVFIDQLSHFNADATYGGKDGSGMFSWGKNGASDKTDDGSVEPIGTATDPETGLEVPVYPDRTPEVFPADTTGLGIDWVLKSQGQSLIWQNISPGTKDVGDGSSYNPASADDVDTLITKYDIQFYKTYENQYNAVIESKPFQGPFDIVAFIGNASSGNHKMLFEVSTDDKTWTQVGDTIDYTLPQRLYKKFTRGYRGTDNVYVRLRQVAGGTGAQVYDIYIFNEGEKSKAVEAELQEAYVDGIEDLTAPVRGNAKVAAVYSINGTRINGKTRGINIIKYADGSVKKIIVK